MSTVMREDVAERVVESENESEAARLEQRWFAACKHAQAMRLECEILRDVLETAHANWREAVSRLTSVEALRDALEAECGSHTGQGRHLPFLEREAISRY
ncbi:MAG TPA: hypothetical protein VGI93_14040 [Steroidobacteraceae bacterium]|jgi:hypothetical protein